MILAIDIGNTQTVIGEAEDGELGVHWRISTDATLTADEIRIKIGGLLATTGRTFDEVERLVVASVVPRLTEASSRSRSRRPAGRRWSWAPD